MRPHIAKLDLFATRFIQSRTLEHEKQQTICRNYTAGQDCSHVYEYVGRAVIAPIAGSVTPRRNQGPKRDEWRSEQDLQAQWDMARFALWGAFAAWAGAFVTGVGIFFVWRTLEANRDAVRQAQRTADIAEEAFRRLERPYLLTPFQIRSATGQHRRHGGVSGGGKGRGQGL